VHTRSYLLSKVLVVLTTSLLSSLAVTVPVMGLQPNYLLFIPAAALVSVFSCMLGLWLASFFEDLKSAFGVLFLIMAVMMLPAMSSIIPGFAPLWLRLMPTYPMLQAVTQSLLPRPDVWYTLLVLLAMAAVSAVLLYWSEHRYRKSWGV
jgi:ABC-type Na+ efflux pump permease subunit